MKRFILSVLTLALVAAGNAEAKPKKSVLDHDPDLFAVVTPDRLLGDTTRRKWLELWPVNGREYWKAWDCKGQPCDNPERKHVRETAKLIPRLPGDPKPPAGSASPS